MNEDAAHFNAEDVEINSRPFSRSPRPPRLPWRDRLGRWANRQVCRLKGHDLTERDEHGWPRFKVCTRCGHLVPPPANPGAGPPDELRPRTRTRER